MQIGIRDNLLAQKGVETNLEDKFARARLLGFAGIEFIIGDRFQENLLWQQDGAEQLKKISEDTGVAVPSLSPGGFSNRSFIVEEPLRSEGIEMLRVCARAARTLEAKVILVPFFGQYRLTAEHVNSPAVIDGLKSLDAIAEECDITWAIESTLNAEQHTAIIANARSRRVGVYYDVANATSFGYHAPSEIRALGKHIAMIHMKDTDGKDLGEGRVPFDDCFAAIREIGYDGWLVLETPTGDDALQSARKNLEFVRKFL